MGTNYYWLQLQRQFPEDEDSIFVHIGKRSAAGAYCWDCHTTLNRFGTDFVHQHGENTYGENWLAACPVCGKTNEDKDSIVFGDSTGVELGFAKAADVTRSGVSTCSSFRWTLWMHRWILRDHAAKGNPKKLVVNEYGDEFTAAEFFDELAAVAIEQTSPSEFS